MIKMYEKAYCILLGICLLGCSSEQKMPALESIKSTPDVFHNNTLVGLQNDNTYVVSTSQKIDPAGKTITFPGRAYDLALNTDETILAVKNMTNVVFFNVQDQSIMQTLPLPPKGGSSFNGINWNSEDKKCWITDKNGFLRSAAMNENGLFYWKDEIALPSLDKKSSYPGGF